jgi:hypothetical protein
MHKQLQTLSNSYNQLLPLHKETFFLSTNQNAYVKHLQTTQYTPQLNFTHQMNKGISHRINKAPLHEQLTEEPLPLLGS